MVTVEKHQAKQDALNKAKFQVSILKRVLKTEIDENIKVILDGSIESLEGLIAVTENEHK